MEQNQKFSPNRDQRSRRITRSSEKSKLNGLKTIAIVVLAFVILVVGGWFMFKKNMDSRKGDLIDIEKGDQEKPDEYPLANTGDVSPITGIACENWNKRPVAFMQPADVQARPAAGFSEADIVFEMPAYTSSVTRLMGVYLCNIPEEVGAMRSSRHDYIHLAKGLDAVFVHWGGSAFALNLLDKGVIDNMDCNFNACSHSDAPCYGKYCGRWYWSSATKRRAEDTGYMKKDKIEQMMTDLQYQREGKFSGYPHQGEAPLEDRPENGHLRIAFADPYDVEYDYDKETNSYLRIWDEVEDVDKNNNKRIAPKNIVVMTARSEQVTLTQDYTGKGLQDPWADIPEIKSTGVESISGRYNNVQIGDPWYDEIESGIAKFYFNGKEITGRWEKDSSDIGSKLMFFDENEKEVKFVPGQIWVEIIEPGYTLKWETGDDVAESEEEMESEEE